MKLLVTKLSKDICLERLKFAAEKKKLNPVLLHFLYGFCTSPKNEGFYVRIRWKNRFVIYKRSRNGTQLSGKGLYGRLKDVKEGTEIRSIYRFSTPYYSPAILVIVINLIRSIGQNWLRFFA